jgi:zinc/manganese transport system substrate-binding protein
MPLHKGEQDVDPHVWLDPVLMTRIVDEVRSALSDADPSGAPAFADNATAYAKELSALDQEYRTGLTACARTLIITSHEAFGYFGATYGLEFIAPEGVSTESEASAKDVAKIIRQIKKQKIPAVFMENVSDRRLLDQIARETGAKIGGTLYSDALSDPSGPAGTYLDMFRHNIQALTRALSS